METIPSNLNLVQFDDGKYGIRRDVVGDGNNYEFLSPTTDIFITGSAPHHVRFDSKVGAVMRMNEFNQENYTDFGQIVDMDT